MEAAAAQATATGAAERLARREGSVERVGEEFAVALKDKEREADELRAQVFLLTQRGEADSGARREEVRELHRKIDELTGELRAARGTEIETQQTLTEVVRQLQDAEARVKVKEATLHDYDSVAQRAKHDVADQKAVAEALRQTNTRLEKELLLLSSELEQARFVIRDVEEDRLDLIHKAQELKHIVRRKVVEDENTERRTSIVDAHNSTVEDLWRRGAGGGAPSSVGAGSYQQVTPRRTGGPGGSLGTAPKAQHYSSTHHAYYSGPVSHP